MYQYWLNIKHLIMLLQPHYEQVACLFNHPNAVHGDEVFVAKVDCKLAVSVLKSFNHSMPIWSSLKEKENLHFHLLWLLHVNPDVKFDNLRDLSPH